MTKEIINSDGRIQPRRVHEQTYIKASAGFHCLGRNILKALGKVIGLWLIEQQEDVAMVCARWRLWGDVWCSM